MKLVDTIIVLEDGRAVDIGSPSTMLQKNDGYIRKLGLLISEPSADELAPEEIKTASKSNKHEPDLTIETSVEASTAADDAETIENSALTDIRRKNGELSVYTYYLTSSGYIAVIFYILSMALWILCTEFSSKYEAEAAIVASISHSAG